MGTKYSANSVSGYNATPPVDDGTVSEANKVKWVTIKEKLPDPLKTTIEAIDSDLTTHFNTGPTALTSNTTLGVTHYNQYIQVSGAAVTLTLSDAATLADWYCTIVNTDSSNAVTIARATALDTINGSAANFTLAAGQAIDVFVNAADNGFIVRSLVTNPVTTDSAQTITATKTLLGAALELDRGADVASATTTNIWGGSDGNVINITGTTTITSFGTAPQAGAHRILTFASALTLTHSGTTLLLPGAANITTATNDWCEVYAISTTELHVTSYQRANGTPVALAQGAIVQEVEAADTTSQSTTSTTFADTALDVTITPRFSNSIIEVYATLPRIAVQADGAGSATRQATFKISNSTDAADITGEYLVGRDLVATSTVAALTRTPLTMIGRYTVNSLTARSFVVRYKANTATVVNVLLEADLSTNTILAREIRQ